MAKLLTEKNGETYWKDVTVTDTPADLKGLLNETRWSILKLLAERPRYPAAIADELDMHEQKVYYHIRELESQGIISVADRKEKGGAVAKYYTVEDHAWALELPYGDERVSDIGMTADSGPLRSFLRPFIQNGACNADIVVGSPDPHGPHQVRSRDAHLATDLGLFLGQYGAFDTGRTRQDVEVKAAADFTGNLILLGGPLTNMVTAEVNAHLPVKFATENFPFRKVESEISGQEYTDGAVGFIARAAHPDDPSSSVLVLAGVRLKGTRAAVMALTEHHDDLLDGYEGEEKWGAVVRGRDMDGDGKIDDIEILE